MTARTGKDAAPTEPEAVGPDAEYEDEEEFEDDLKELVERLVRRSRPRPAPKRRKGAGESGDADEVLEEAEEDADEIEADADTDADTEVDAEVDAEPDAEIEAEAEVDGEAADAGAEAGVEGDAPAPADPLERARTRVTLLTVLSGVLAVLLVAAGVVAVLASRSSGDSGEQHAVAERAGYITTTLYNYDYRDTTKFLANQAEVTGAAEMAVFNKSKTAIIDYIQQNQIVYWDRVNEVYVGDISAKKASAIVDIDMRITSSQFIANFTGTVIQLDLVKEKGVWKLASAIQPLYAGTEKDTDTKGNPLPSASASPSATPSGTAKK